MHGLKSLISGQQPLERALWGYLVVGSILVAIVVIVLGVLVISADPPARVPTYVTTFFVIWSYVFLAAIGTWRSASRASGRLAVVAKIIVVLLVCYFALNLFQSNGVMAMMRGTWQPAPGSYLKELMERN